MVWLVSHIWALLGIALLGGLLVGWAFRGLLLVGRLRRAEVERDVTVTELEHARQEIEGLYAAQRRQPAAGDSDEDGEAAPGVSHEAPRIIELETELASLKAEHERLRAAASDPGMGEGAVLAGAVAGGAALLAGRPGDNETGEGAEGLDTELDPEKLQWRNRYLESRVRVLEGQVHAQMTGAAAQGDGDTAPLPVPARIATPAPIAPEQAAETDMDEAELDKLRWQTRYLRQRLALFEAQAAAPTAAVIPPEPRASGETIDEELARLRWRNRYLEGRLAYLEEAADAEPEPVQTDAAPGVLRSAEEAAPEALAPPEPAPELVSAPAETALEQEAPDIPEAEAGSTSDVPADPAPLPDTLDTADMAVTPADAAEPASEPGPAPSVATEPLPEPEQPAPEPMQGKPLLTTGGFSAFGGGFGGFSPQPARPDGEPEAAAAPGIPAEPVADAPQSSGEAAADADPTADRHGEVAQESASAVAVEEPERLDGPRKGVPDDLTRIDGIGPRISDILNGLGIWHLDQIARWSEANEAWIDQELSFTGRVRQEAWVSQAKDLIEGQGAPAG